eukprot:PITA_24027
MACSQIAAASSSPRANPRAEYYPLWRHVTKLQICGGCTKTTNPLARRAYQREEDEADGNKRRHDDLTQTPSNIEPRIVAEARKRRAGHTEQHEQLAPKNTRGPGASPSVQDSKIARLVNVQAREETDSRVARCIYACGIPFNVVRSPYWQDMIRVVNKARQGYKGPNYEKIITQLLKNEKELVEEILALIRSSWSSFGVTIVSNGWTDIRRKPLITIIATSPKGAMFIKV